MLDEVFTYKNLVHAFSGSLGGIIAISLSYPLNSIRTRIQIDDCGDLGPMGMLIHVMKTEGWRALFQGWSSTCCSLGASNFVYFYSYNMLKTLYILREAKLRNLPLKGPNSPKFETAANLVVAALAGIINVLTTTPLWVVGTRLTVQHQPHPLKPDVPKDNVSLRPLNLQTPTTIFSMNPLSPSAHGIRPSFPIQKAQVDTVVPRRLYKGMWDCFYRTFREEGLLSLWGGLWPSLILVSNPTIHFLVYEKLKKAVVSKVNRQITPFQYFLMGACSKAIATVITYPVQLAQTKMRNAKLYSNTFECLLYIMQQQGWQGWYRGMDAKLWQTILTAAIQFLTYEQIAQLVFALLLREKYVGSPGGVP